MDPVPLPWHGPPELSKLISSAMVGDVYIFTEAGDVVTAVEPTGKLGTTWGKVKATEVFQNYPNPFNPETWIPYRLSESSDVQISIYSANGELIRDFNLGHQAHGEKKLYWDGKNRDGETGRQWYLFLSIPGRRYPECSENVVNEINIGMAVSNRKPLVRGI